MNMEEFEMICFQLISNSGASKSSYVEAIQKAKEGDFEGAQAKMEEGDQYYTAAHEVHTEMLQKEATGEKTMVSLILIHAEDQMASTEMAKLLAEETIAIYKKLQ